MKNVVEVLAESIENIDTKFRQDELGLAGISTGYDELDLITQGFKPGELIIIAARPSMGKSTLAQNILEHISITSDRPSLFFSLEALSDQVMTRMLASLGRIEHRRLQTGQLDDESWSRLSSAIELLNTKANLYISDVVETIDEIIDQARTTHSENRGLSSIVIDYIQLIRLSKKKDYTENRTQELAEISRRLKLLGKELRVPIIVVSQLNRMVEQRADKRPVNSDLRDSGSLEDDADLIMFIYRDEVYNDDSPDKGTAEVIIGKQRNGPIGRVRLTFHGRYSRFDNYAGSARFEDD